jgi:hypothetical protein
VTKECLYLMQRWSYTIVGIREWLKRIRGEVDAGLQRLDLLLKDVEPTGPGQGRMSKEWALKPKKTLSLEERSFSSQRHRVSVGLGLGPNVCKVNGQPRSSKTTVGTTTMGLGLVVGSSGHPNGPQGVGCSKEKMLNMG